MTPKRCAQIQIKQSKNDPYNWFLSQNSKWTLKGTHRKYFNPKRYADHPYHPYPYKRTIPDSGDKWTKFVLMYCSLSCHEAGFLLIIQFSSLHKNQHVSSVVWEICVERIFRTSDTTMHSFSLSVKCLPGVSKQRKSKREKKEGHGKALQNKRKN